jgi:hypothetical protein
MSATATDAAWAALCDELVEIEHQLWRAALPAGYQPLQRDLATFHSLLLEVTEAEHADLLARRQALCLRAAHMSAEQQRAAHGQVDAWLLAYIAELEATR